LSTLSSSKERQIRALPTPLRHGSVTLRQAQRDEVHGAMTIRASSFDKLRMTGDKLRMTRLFDELAPA
jgi:hypothetical protein